MQSNASNTAPVILPSPTMSAVGAATASTNGHVAPKKRVRRPRDPTFDEIGTVLYAAVDKEVPFWRRAEVTCLEVTLTRDGIWEGRVSISSLGYQDRHLSSRPGRRRRLRGVAPGAGAEVRGLRASSLLHYADVCRPLAQKGVVVAELEVGVRELLQDLCRRDIRRAQAEIDAHLTDPARLAAAVAERDARERARLEAERERRLGLVRRLLVRWALECGVDEDAFLTWHREGVAADVHDS